MAGGRADGHLLLHGVTGYGVFVWAGKGLEQVLMVAHLCECN